MEKGILYGIGVGPGDPDLMTVKAVKTANACDVIVVPNKDLEKCTAYKIALGACEGLEKKTIVPVDMPMTKDPVKLQAAYENGANTVESFLNEGKTVGFLTLGDTTVYSTYMYIHKIVQNHGYETHIIPGITSFCAAAAELQISLCENADELHVIPGTYNPADGLDYPGTKVIMKNNLAETKKALIERNLDAYMVEDCGMPSQKVYMSTEEIPEKASYFTLLVVKDKK